MRVVDVEVEEVAVLRRSTMVMSVETIIVKLTGATSCWWP